MVTVVIFTFLVAGMVSVQIFGSRIYALAATKLSATAGGRKTLNAMRDTIRSANTVLVGTFDPTNNAGFTQTPNGQQQIGNAVAIQYTNGLSTNYLIFYKDPTNPTNVVCSYSNGVLSVLASYVTNYDCFQAEDYQGNILTNYENNPVIRITMQFSKWEYPIGFIGSNSINAYNFYQLRTRVARREK